MPAVRQIEKSAFSYSPTPSTKIAGNARKNKTSPPTKSVSGDDMNDSLTEPPPYPLTVVDRANFRTRGGKPVTSHQWAVYDQVRKIPPGRVSTYKHVCVAIGEGSSRSVGTALRNNPFAPIVPCHRVIASNLFVGGFFGEWGHESKTGTQCNRKLQTLASEGVGFDSRDRLRDSSQILSF